MENDGSENKSELSAAEQDTSEAEGDVELHFTTMENDGSDNKSETFSVENHTSEAEGDVELYFTTMENDGSDNKSETFAVEKHTSEAERDVELPVTLYSQRSLINVLTTVGTILVVSCCSLVQMKCDQQYSNIFHNQL